MAKGYSQHWCVAKRMTPHLRAKGTESAIHPTTYKKLEIQYERITGREAWRIAKRYEQDYGITMQQALSRGRALDYIGDVIRETAPA
jgi:hypothetical protein